MLNKANPDAADAAYCKSSMADGECALNSEALSSINKAIRKYGVSARGEIVATLSWMLFESGNWVYNINHFPGNIGQGTRTMMTWEYVAEYAKTLHPDAYAKALGSGDVSAANNSTKTDVIDLVLNNDDSFGSGFWYLTTKAASFHGNANSLRDGNKADFQKYVEDGIVTTWTTEREDVWTMVNSAIVF
ncbi:hypothetical protein LPJ77_001143 [Coemansia sp. RSA 2523]|nr:hypothetical protein LPJ77_001143 [Coemansia sp. RSA 2523]KAJ2146958.1 hypothetical protein IW142_001847 [Coemansia sp. RSA 564]KAJ2154820.1 hypothetical protein GGH15_005800 [Coemansia sp. RSA 562]KAJ2249911.1 hypothetical protein GGH97_001056 [Coemansia sp. RSA 475]KAJ2255930.1 hypothetical protein GGH98_001797 [Coemansia sp. RSA 454]KAJ2265534.1 hypothetical protein EV176_005905 [Coemansia sp. RSA 451]KAJ2408852.1 hypothetical protein J3F80_001753 [Coemansia sp. RSA 2526]KAJ2428023.1 h